MGSINIEPGQVAGDVSDVNGSIHIGEHATVANVGGVNGSIHIAQGASAGSLHTVTARFTWVPVPTSQKRSTP